MPPRALSHLLAGLLVCSALVLAAAAPASAAPCRYRNLTPRAANLGKIRSAVRCLLNRERTKRGIAPLRSSGALTQAAQSHSADMVRNRYFDHVAPDGSTPQSRTRAAGYPGGYIGENIAWGSGPYATPRRTVIDWMSSSGHRRNILDPKFRDGGAGVAVGGPQGGSGATYTTTFGGGP